MTAKSRTAWTFAVTSTALFMASLDNLVVTTALPSIRAHLHASLQGLQWTVNAYTLTFAVLLLTGATLGERYGRRRLFVIGLGLFTAGSAAAALAPGIGALVTARAIQGVGAAIVIPLTLTLLSAAVTPERRGLALGAWGAVGGLAIAIGPLVGGAVVEGASWQWIFWLNVPIGIVLLPIAWTRLTESRGPATSLDLPGLVLASVGLLGIVYGVVRGNDHGWTSATVLPPLVIGAALVAAFVAWELRAREPMLPMHLFRSRGFTMTNAASLLMFFGMFGSIFLLAQFLQVVQHYSPLQAGLRTLPWTGMPVLIAPVAGALSDRIGGRPLLATGLALQAIGLGWLAAVASPTVAYTTRPWQLPQRYGVRLRPGAGDLGRRGRGGRRVRRRAAPAADAPGRDGRCRGRARSRTRAGALTQTTSAQPGPDREVRARRVYRPGQRRPLTTPRPGDMLTVVSCGACLGGA